MRQGRHAITLLPYLLFFNYTTADRENARNILLVRNFCQKLIDDRRKNLDKFKDSHDLMNIWLTDETYQNNDKLIIDEIILMFLAGSFTLKTTNTNMLSYLALCPEVKTKLIRELKETVLKEHMNGAEKEKPVNTHKAFTFESIDSLRYFTYCFYESLRIESPTLIS